jgi:hypothetical protein
MRKKVQEGGAGAFLPIVLLLVMAGGNRIRPYEPLT